MPPDILTIGLHAQRLNRWRARGPAFFPAASPVFLLYVRRSPSRQKDLPTCDEEAFFPLRSPFPAGRLALGTEYRQSSFFVSGKEK